MSAESLLETAKSFKVGSPIGSGPQGKDLDVYYCANSKPHEMKYCLKQGGLRCGGCHLVGYCSVACQKEHWKEHKKVCRHSQFRSDTWQPSWFLEERIPEFVDVKQTVPLSKFGPNIYIWGNTPAFDLIGWKRNEFKDSSDWQQPMNIAFAASGDFRSMVETLASVPDTYEEPITLVLNDIDRVVVARNLLMLSLLLFKGEEALDTVIAMWYSAAMTKHQSGFDCNFVVRYLLPLFDRIRMEEQIQFSIIELNQLDKAFANIFSMMANDLDVQSARNNIMLNQSRKDCSDRYLVGLKDYHRESYNHFLSHGQLLPFGGLIADHNVANNLMFHTELGWLVHDTEQHPGLTVDPRQGWSMLKVMKFGDEKKLPKNDLYGRLFYYIKDRLCKMIATIRRIPVRFRLFNKDANDLANDFQQEGIKFDRVDVSNISDVEYIGIDTVLNDWGPLLNKSNPNSSIVTLFLNWHLKFSDTGEIDFDQLQLSSEMRPKVAKLLQMLQIMDSPSELFHVPFALLALTDHSEYFEKYMKVVLKNKPGYLKRRLNHKIVPHQVMYPIEASREDVIDSLSESDQYFVFNCSTNYSTRYVEWEMA